MNKYFKFRLLIKEHFIKKNLCHRVIFSNFYYRTKNNSYINTRVKIIYSFLNNNVNKNLAVKCMELTFISAFYNDFS